MSKATKIVATISDKRCDVDFIRELYIEGMNVVRMNSAHLDREGFLKIIGNVRAVSNHIGLLMDTKGPEVRTTIAENDNIEITAGDIIQVKGDPDKLSVKGSIYVNYPHFTRDLHVGDDILIDDGEIDLKVESKANGYLHCIALNDGVLGSRKSVNVPGVRINLPSLTEKDKGNILFAIEQDIDFIAHSFVRNKQDLMDIQKILDEHNSSIKIISKIENQEGVDNIDEILEYTYGVMIARGDLGIEVAQEKIPGIQRRLIRKCVQARKPVIVATQMLHSMIKNPRPTRAEVTDIANAIYYRTDALMLSGETAYGKYPVEAVKTMAKIIRSVEESSSSIYYSLNYKKPDWKEKQIVESLAYSCVTIAENVDAKAISTITHSGNTAKRIAKFRPKVPIIAFTESQSVRRQLNLVWGVQSIRLDEIFDTDMSVKMMEEYLASHGLVNTGDRVIIATGIPLAQRGRTNMIKVSTIENE